MVDPSSVSPIVAQALQASRGHLSQDAPQQSRHNLDSTQRRDMLGETPLQGKGVSVYVLRLFRSDLNHRFVIAGRFGSGLSHFHYTVTKRIHNNDMITLSIETLEKKCH